MVSSKRPMTKALQQQLAKIKNLTDGNIGLKGENIKSKKNLQLLGDLAVEFSKALSYCKGEMPTVSTGEISAGYIHGDLVMLFRDATETSTQEESGVLVTKPQASSADEFIFESVSDARNRLNAPVSLFIAVQEEVGRELEAVVNALK